MSLQCCNCYIMFKSKRILEKHKSTCPAVYFAANADDIDSIEDTPTVTVTTSTEYDQESDPLNLAENASNGIHITNELEIDYECPDCHYRFSSEDKFISHNAKCKGDEPEQVNCDNCNLVFPNRSCYNDHIDSAHTTNEGAIVYKCAVCLTSSNHKEIIVEHIQICSVGNERRVCELCDISFPDHESYNNHKKTEHSLENSLAYSCPYCEEKFEKKGLMQKHSSTCAKAPPKLPIKCDECNKNYISTYALKRHRQIKHSEETEIPVFACDNCKKTFIQKGKMLIHYNKCIKSLKEIKLTCNNCDMNFSSSGTLKRHIKENHSNGLYNLSCDVCKKEFKRSGNLKGHQLRVCHNPNFNLRCNKCNINFNDVISLKEHKTNVHDTKSPHKNHTNNVISVENSDADILECHECSSVYKYKKSLQRHIKRSHKQSENILYLYRCSHPSCDTTFVDKGILKSHMENIHKGYNFNTIDNVQFELACKLCDARYMDRDELVEHINNVHANDLVLNFECKICNKIFKRKSNFKRHAREVHVVVEKKYECATCSKAYSRKELLKRHIKHSHPKQCGCPQNSFICAHCNKPFGQKTNLIRHIRMLHYVEKEQSEFACQNCQKAYKTKDELLTHIRMCSEKKWRKFNKKRDFKQPAKSKFSVVCLECKVPFSKKTLLYQHYELEHNIFLKYETLHFSTHQEFVDWKRRICQENIISFRQRHAWKGREYNNELFECHRSGAYCSEQENPRRMRRLKENGSKRLGGICPANIMAKQNLQDSSYTVVYQSVHIGHAVGDESELKHIFLSEDERRIIADKIRSGIPIITIYEQIKSEAEETLRKTGKITRLSRLSLKDIHNIAYQCDIRLSMPGAVKDKSDVNSIDMIVDRHQHLVLFYKAQFHANPKYPSLDKDDMMLVIMSQTQVNSLRRYGSKAVALDGTHNNTLKFGFILHTLLFVDVDNEGVPAAFLITNRNDAQVIEIFLQLVRDKLGGQLNPAALITDIRNHKLYTRCWKRTMNSDPVPLYCTWHVLEAWRKRRWYTITGHKQKQCWVMEQLEDMINERSVKRFEQRLARFFEIEDHDLRKFQDYLRVFYEKSKRKWAHCYRRRLGSNTNMQLESYEKTFKAKIKDCGDSGKNLKAYVLHVFNYLNGGKGGLQFNKSIEERFREKLEILEARHKQAEAECLSVSSCNERTWIVQRFKEEDDPTLDGILYSNMSTMEKVTRNMVVACKGGNGNGIGGRAVCQTPCTFCNCCYHEYRCTCVDFVDEENMCKHIHAVGLYIKSSMDDNVEMDEGSDTCVDDGTIVINLDPNRYDNNELAMCEVVDDVEMFNVDAVAIDDYDIQEVSIVDMDGSVMNGGKRSSDVGEIEDIDFVDIEEIDCTEDSEMESFKSDLKPDVKALLESMNSIV